MIETIKGWLLSLSSLTLSKLVPAIVILLAGILTIRIITTVVRKTLERSKLEKAAHNLIKSLVNVVLYLVLGLIVASSIGLDVSSIVALASVLTLALSLALQNALTNVIGGFTLLYTHPFHSGDFVEIADKSGTVHEIGMSYTVLLTPDNKRVSIPNSSVVAGDIINYTVTGTRRVDIPISVSYSNPPQKVIDTLLLAADMPQILADPAPVAAVSGYGQSTVDYVLRVWVNTANYWDVLNAINLKLLPLFNENGIEVTYPHLNIHMK